MNEWGTAGSWIVYGGLPVLGMALAVLLFFTLLFLRRRFAVSSLVQAEILRLSPRFHPDHPIRTEWLKCDYVFRVRDEAFHGTCLLPVHMFLGHPQQIMIWKDSRLDLPVLFHDGRRFVGAESIEHHLLTFREHIRIRYRNRDPLHNAPVEADILPKKVVENRSTGS